MNTITQTTLLSQLGNFITIILPTLAIIYKGGKSLYAEYHNEVKLLVGTKTDAIQNAELREDVKSAENTIDNLINKEIINADVTLKPVILSAIAKGTMTIDDINNIKNVVRENVINQIPKDAQAAIPSLTADFTSYLNSAIEAELGRLKLDPTSPVTKTVIPEAVSTTVDSKIGVSLEDHQAVVNENNQLKSQLKTIQSTFDAENLGSSIEEDPKTIEAVINNDTMA